MRSLLLQIRTYLFVGVFLLATGLGTQLHAQSATVSGQVLDASGAAVKGATVTLLRPTTQVKMTTVSDPSGIFILPPVAPGHYEITVTATGYSPWVDTGITLEIGEKKAVTAVLPVGSVNETVTVNDAPAELQVEDADRSTLLEPSLTANMPLDPRNPLQLIAATVGVTTNDTGTSGTNNTTESTTNQFRINGAKYATTDLLIDGGANMVAYNSQAAGIPGVDATSEFRVLTDAYAPEYGYTSGGIVNMSLKSGTNKIHGGLWEYYRSQFMDANGYNANLANEPRPDLLRNQFGGQFGGPIIIPKLYNGHDKTFFFFSYEGLRDTYEPAGGYTALVPTDAMIGRNGLPGGDFSYATNSANYPIPVPAAGKTPMSAWGVFDPTNIVGSNRQAFTNGGSSSACTSAATLAALPANCNVIPASRIDPVGQKLLSMYPSPTPGFYNGTTQTGANYFSNATEGDTDNSIDLRIDHQFNAKHNMFGHFDRFSNYIFNPDDYGPTGLGSQQEPTNSNDRIPGYHALVNHTWTITNDLIFNQHGSWGHSESNRASTKPLSPNGVFGINALAAPGRTGVFTPQIESVSGQLSTIGNSEPLETNKSSVYQYQADLSWLKGKHTFKMGGDIRRYFVQHWDPQLMTLTGGKALTGGPTASTSVTNGSAIAEILLGYTPMVSGYEPLVTLRDMVYFVYGEDTYKVTHKLTATFGIRYGIIGSWVTDGNMLNYLDETSPSAIAQNVTLPTGAPLVGGIGIPGVSISSRTEQNPSLAHVEPRLGLSYALNSNTVIHAGFGIFRYPQASEASYSELGGTARVSTSVSSQTVGSNVVLVPGSSTGSPGYYTLGNPFFASAGAPPAPYGDNPTPLAGNNVGSGPLSIELGQTVEGDLRQQTGPYQENYSFDVQRAMKGHFVLTAGYAGSQGVRMRSGVQMNQLSDSALAQCANGSPLTPTVTPSATDKAFTTCTPLSTSINNPFYNVITDTSAANSLAKSTLPAGNLLRAYPQFGKFEPIDVGWGHSSYNALQVAVQHREANGLSLLVGYTYSKAIDQTGDSSSTFGIQDNACHSCERAVSEQNQTHNFTESTMYELPFGHGRMFLNSGLPAVLAGGWQLGTAYKFYSGTPVQLSETATSLVGNTAFRPTIVPGVSVKPTSSTQYFNPAAFSVTPAYQFGNAPRYQSNIHYPDYQNLDAFVQKETRFANERMGVTIRFEALNALNTVVFGANGGASGATAMGANVSTSSSFGNKILLQSNNPREAQLSARFTF
jgi:hypothetical protein